MDSFSRSASCFLAIEFLKSFSITFNLDKLLSAIAVITGTVISNNSLKQFKTLFDVNQSEHIDVFLRSSAMATRDSNGFGKGSARCPVSLLWFVVPIH